MYPKIIGVVGPIRAGKTTASNYIVSKYGYLLASNSDVLRAILSRLHLDATRDNLSMLGNAIHEVMGNETIARYRLSKLEEGPIIVDGIRYLEELREYEKEPSFRLLGIKADDNVRYQRAMDNNSIKDAQVSKDTFLDLSEARSEINVPQLLSRAHRTLINQDGPDVLAKQLDDVMAEWSRSLN